MTNWEKIKFIQRVLEGETPIKADIETALQFSKELRQWIWEVGHINLETKNDIY